MLHKSNFRATGPGRGSCKGACQKMQHLDRKQQLGWSNFVGLVRVRNFSVKAENNKESGMPFQLISKEMTPNLA